MQKIDDNKNRKYIELLAKTLDILEEEGIRDIFVIGSIAVSGHLGKTFKTFGDIEAIARQKDLSIIVEILRNNGYKVLEDLDDRTAFILDNLWIGFIDRSKKFKIAGLDPNGAYQDSKTVNLYGCNFKILNKKYLKELYKMGITKGGDKKIQYQGTLDLL